MKDELEGFCRVAVVEFEEVGEGLALLEGDDGQQGVAGERQVERGFGPAMAVAVFLPRGCVAFVVVAVLDAPVLPGGPRGTGFFLDPKAGEEDPGVAPGRCGVFLLDPIAAHGHRGAGARQPGGDRRDGFRGGFAGVDAPVVALAAQIKKGEPSRARAAASRRLGVFSLVPTR